MTKPFKDLFKPGDVICSDKFYQGRLLVVEGFNCGTHMDSYSNDDYYTVSELFNEKQKWVAYKHTQFLGKEYNWRLATDDDMHRALEAFIESQDTSIGGVKISCYDNYINLKQMDDYILLDIKSAAELRDYLNKNVIGG